MVIIMRIGDWEIWAILFSLLPIAMGCQGTREKPFGAISATDHQSTLEIVGTWQWKLLIPHSTGDKMLVKEPFFMRFYEDGTGTTWPTPSGDISRRHFEIHDGKLLLRAADGETLLAALPLRVDGKELVITNGDGDVTVYEKLSENLEPGRIPSVNKSPPGDR
jgi:hypothetical protein